MMRADNAHGRRQPAGTATPSAARWPARRSAFARLAVCVALVLVTAVLWLVILRIWADAAGRAVPPVGSGMLATEQGPA